MAFMDGPFGFAPQKKQPGLFNQPPSPVSNASPPVNGGVSFPSQSFAPSPSSIYRIPGGNSMPPVTAGVSPTPMGGGLAVPKLGGQNSSPAPYSYSGPTMRLLNDQQSHDMLAPAAPPGKLPIADRGGFMDGIFNWRQRLMQGGGPQPFF